MERPTNADSWALTDKQKQTLRLMVRGHDAKSIARALDISVHTINERLRDARSKMAVSSSREAARMLFEAEGEGGAAPDPYSLRDTPIGDDAARGAADIGNAPLGGAGRAFRRPGLVLGGTLMTFTLGLLALLGLPQTAPAPVSPPAAASDAANPEIVAFARQWLELVDQARWDASYRATGTAFQKLNTLQVWTDVSEKVRTPLGAVVSRTLLSQENLPAPPSGYEVVKFRTSFANKPDTIETVTLDRENGDWRVVGVMIG
ncbi:helix-turn-helix domain-containing protein [Sphingomonas baiyangensis]|uniref:DUF4019 domain-containing protein n=1 Tax=Sphingomonas baiyangensis TaxID=2572576 RepID=A0A4U1L1M1_9SPHN|nr:DUF4019 domain-containing protein [Sphingomonas baiyangensis]TKD49906.1 DUF4019 domain-containing protein [Sphingomonas baiyangensis]